VVVDRRSNCPANDGIAQSSRYGDEQEKTRALRSERSAGAAKHPAKYPLRRLKNGLSHCPQRACHRAQGRQRPSAGIGLLTTPDRRFEQSLSDRRVGRGDAFIREQIDLDMCTRTTAGDDAGGQAMIPSASRFAARGGTTERLQHSAQRLLWRVRPHEYYRSAFFDRVGRHSVILRHLCDNHSPLRRGWRAALRCNPARLRDRGRKGKGCQGRSPCLRKRISSVGKVRPSDPRGSPGDSPGRRSRSTTARARAESLAMQEYSSALQWPKASRSPMEFRP
jgi:hypothetical protein